jgi:hypothetical protein
MIEDLAKSMMLEASMRMSFKCFGKMLW